ncbi:MAG: DUF2867 domain-containing protein [Planctomycetota bacterium]|nr:DUF2867 domain-containing protein [Planctomycetota bacterium]
MSDSKIDSLSIFVTGATGYVGGRLVPALLRGGYKVRCLAREPRKLAERPWRNDPNVDVVTGDLTNVDELVEQLQGFSVAYFLVHSMEASGGKYAQRDLLLASNFARAAKIAGVERIIYLGGLGELGDGLSQHLRSRREVEETLGSTGVPVTTFRAAMIIGSGSASFEILRYLVERLPVMVTPSWVTTESQPVAISDVLHWLVKCLEVPETVGKTLEIGGADILPYRELMRIMAEELHIPKRWIVPVPILTPKLSSLWISLVTPVSYKIARPLAEGLRNRVVVTDDKTQRLMPHEALGVRDAIKRALHKIELNEVETRWTVAGPILGDPHWAGGKVFTDQRSVMINADTASVFAAVCRIGGGNGWYAGDILWRIRGWMDTVVGGPGLRRGRRDSERVEFGEALDFWRVVGIDRDRSLSLLAEMKLPGVAMLNFNLKPESDNSKGDNPKGNNSKGDRVRTQLTMTARYRPRGLLGILYWYAVVPLHNIVFGGMLKGIRKAAEKSRLNIANLVLESAESTSSSLVRAPVPGYGRARLWLGISGVGTMVTLAAAALTFGIIPSFMPARTAGLGAQIAGLAGFFALYMLIQLPFDFLGGYWLPKGYGRSHPPLGTFVVNLLRGMLTHGALLILAATLIMIAGGYAGRIGLMVAGMFIALSLLQLRTQIASIMSRLDLDPEPSRPGSPAEQLEVIDVHCDDEGFTGGITGVFQPRAQLFPARWREVLDTEGVDLAIARRRLAVKSGSWLRGRVVALMFTAIGLIFASFMVATADLGTGSGTIQFSLWFSLWSFLGLLTLPTLSRQGVIEIDERVQAEGYPTSLMRVVTERLDRLQDGEPVRPSLVETIFHPVPSVENRFEGPRSHQIIGYWDAARTSIYISVAGLGLLGRAVHCNCGRPSLWVFLPTD